jgi:ribose-phosphate pyrophosphokinase
MKNLTQEELNERFVLVSPDVGGTKRVEAYAVRLGLGHVIMHKHRNYDKPGTVDGTTLVGRSGDITGKTAIIIDDIIDSMGTMVAAANELKRFGVDEVIVLVTHGVFSGLAFDRINNCEFIKKVIVTNSLPQISNMKKSPKLEVVDTSDVFISVIRAIQGGTSISALFVQ